MPINANPKIVRSAEGSVTPEGIFCLFDGQRRVMMARYISAQYGMSPDRYRQFCGLPADYPLMAFGYQAEKDRLAAVQAKGKRIRVVTTEGHPSNGPVIVRPKEGSVTRDLIYCLFDGEGLPFPRRHVKEKYGMSWSEYIAYCGLPKDYPSVAPFYSGDDRHLDL